MTVTDGVSSGQETVFTEFLLPETVVHEGGTGPAIDVASCPDALILVTLGITRIVEQQSLDLTVWGSLDGTEWGSKPILTFPQKFYCGTYQMLLDLRDHPSTRNLRVKWQVNQWGKGDSKPSFGIYVVASQAQRYSIARSA